MNAEAIRGVLHWDYPLLMIDSMDVCVPGQRVVTTRRISADDSLVRGGGTFPQMLLLEGMSHSAALLFRLSIDTDREQPPPKLGFLRAALHGSARAGRSITFEVRSLKMTRRGGVFDATARDGERLLARAELAFAVEEGLA